MSGEKMLQLVWMKYIQYKLFSGGIPNNNYTGPSDNSGDYVNIQHIVVFMDQTLFLDKGFINYKKRN